MILYRIGEGGSALALYGQSHRFFFAEKGAEIFSIKQALMITAKKRKMGATLQLLKKWTDS